MSPYVPFSLFQTVGVIDDWDPKDAASRLYEQANITEPSLEAFIVTCSRLIPYHNLLIKALSNVSATADEQWDEVFSFTVRTPLPSSS